MSETADHTEIEPNVDLIEHEGRSFFIIGTAHVSKDSAELVEKVIRERSPDTVAVELCESRFESLSNPQRWKETDIYTVIKSGRAYVLMAQLGTAYYFLFFLILLPLLGKLERPRPLPRSISDPVLAPAE